MSGLVELVLVFGVVLALLVRELVSVRRQIRHRDRESAADDEDARP